jgi:uncharacterized membrane protein
MDLTPYLGWLRYLHVAGAFLFVAGHGVSMAVAFRLRAEREANRMLALLDLSAWSLNIAGIGLLVLLVSGIISGIAGAWFGQAWIWLSLVLLIVIGGLMTPIGGMYFRRIREGLGQRSPRAKPADPDPVPLSEEALSTLLQSRQPELLAVIGGGGFFVILWMMVFKWP